jgi:hypothetical protein
MGRDTFGKVIGRIFLPKQKHPVTMLARQVNTLAAERAHQHQPDFLAMFQPFRKMK